MPLSLPIRAAATAFLATVLVAAGIFAATLADRYASALAGIDREVLLLFLPCCAILLAVIVEVIRMVARGPVELEAPVRRIIWSTEP